MCEECETPIQYEGVCEKCKRENDRECEAEEAFNQRHSVYD